MSTATTSHNKDQEPQKDAESMDKEASERKDEIKQHKFTAEVYDIVDTARETVRIPRKEEIQLVEEGKVPPPPQGGWIWRPARISKQYLDEETKTEYWDIEFTDKEGGKAKISPTENEHLIAPIGTKSKDDVPKHDYKKADKVDVLDIFKSKRTGKLTKKWRKCQVIEVAPYFIRITYETWNAKYDEWIHVIEEADRIMPYGEMTEKALRERIARDKRFKELMEERNKLTVITMLPDGNCLFRTVAHQVYGSPEKHKKVRNECCDYLAKNKARFAGFVQHYGGFDFSKYVKGMRNLGEWGDDPEIRALEELYDRPFVVYESTGNGENTEPRKIHFEGDLPKEQLEGVEPIRVSYHGYNHYNSVVPLDLLKDMDENFNFNPPPRRKDAVIRQHRLKELENGDREVQRIKAEGKRKEQEEKLKSKDKAESKAVTSVESGEPAENLQIEEKLEDKAE